MALPAAARAVDELATPEPSKAEAKPLLRRTPYELWGLFEGLTDMQAHKVLTPLIGRPIQVSGTVSGVGAWTGSFSQVTLETDAEWRHHSIYLMFRDESWVAQLEALQDGDQITVRGELDRLSRVDIQLDNCQLMETEG